MKEAFEKRGMKAKLHRRLASFEEMAKIDKESDLIIYAGYLETHEPMGKYAKYKGESKCLLM